MNVRFDKLWEKLKQANLKKADLQQMTGLSSRTMAKLSRNEDVSITTLKRIGDVLHCTVTDIVSFDDDPAPVVSLQGLRLATVFSGIGAIEHALQRMQLKHSIVFACDNGDIDILSKEVKNDITEMEHEFKELELIIDEIPASTQDDIEQKGKLIAELKHNSGMFQEAKAQLDISEYEQLQQELLLLIAEISAGKDVKKARKKEYETFATTINKSVGYAQKLNTLQATLNVINDFAKDNPVAWLSDDVLLKDAVKSSDNIVWNTVWERLKKIYRIFETASSKRIIKALNDIAERLSMLHERITTLHISKKIASFSTSEEQKEYVDSLYESKKSQNKVRESYLANYSLPEKHFHWNVSFLDGKAYSDCVDLFVGGSPCQSFSLVGKQRGLEDTRGTLFYEYARLVSEIRPKVFIYENVKAVLSNDEGRTWDTMQNVFTSLGYTWSYQVLNAKDYGIPQNRERVFVVGFRNDLQLAKPFEFPQPIPLEKTMQDFLLDNVSGQYYLPTKGVDFVTSEKNLEKRYTQIDGDIQLCQKKNQQFNWHGDFVFVEEAKAKADLMQDLEKYFLSEKVRKYVLASGTKGFYSRPQTDLPIARPLLTTMHKMHRAGVDNYVTTDGRLRKLTPRECLRLMGFCDSFKIVVSDTSMYQQSGNAIVVDVLMAILSQIRKSYPALFEEEVNNG